MPTDTILIDGAKVDMYPSTEEKRKRRKKVASLGREFCKRTLIFPR
jgi:hypothetical protein